MKTIKKVVRDDERAFYGSKNVEFVKVKIEGPADGESAFKECSNIQVIDSSLKLRYPFWHDTKLYVSNCRMTKTCRAPLWYSKDVTINKVKCKGVKAVRECSDVNILDSTFDSVEFGWQSNNLDLVNSSVIGNYAFLHSNVIKLNKVYLKGKYSFQYVTDLVIKDSVLDTKDAFWHAKNVLVENSVVNGEYLAWYAENVKFVNCHIKGTQPICYAKNIVFDNCTFENCDLAFENSEVNGTIKGTLVSIKNPLKGHIVIDEIPEMISNEFNRSQGNFLIEKRK